MNQPLTFLTLLDQSIELGALDSVIASAERLTVDHCWASENLIQAAITNLKAARQELADKIKSDKHKLEIKH